MADNQPIVRTSDGALRGEKLESVRGGSYYSFKGIPYAKPPVGDLRFKAPEPVEPWTGTRDALKHGPQASSMDYMMLTFVEESSEDCLYLNVYTPKIPESETDKLKPVLVFVHGGAFSLGSGNSEIYGPDYLITEDVVLVTINYRLGALGFLSLQTEECPGNFGLKDQTFALKWVQRNISAFGGDPKNVTIFGESAGGASVQYLLISKSTQGLFQRAISQSATTLDHWSLRTNPRDYAFALGEALGLKTKDEKVLLEFLKKAPAKDLVEAELKLPKNLRPHALFPGLGFVPVVEPDHEGAFLSKTPREIFQSGDFNDVPYIIGLNTLEGVTFICHTKSYKESIADEDLKQILPSDLHIDKDSPLTKEIINKIRNRYFPNGFEMEKFVYLLSRIDFLNGIQKTCDYLGKLKNRKSPTYFYRFTFDGNKAFWKNTIAHIDMKGTCHGDELGYLFHMSMLQSQLVPCSQEYVTVERLTKMWTDFARTGNPTPNDNIWKPISENNFNYLEIGDSLEFKKDFELDEYEFWNEIYKSACNSNK